MRRGLLQAEDLEKSLELQRERGDKIGKILNEEIETCAIWPMKPR